MALVLNMPDPYGEIYGFCITRYTIRVSSKMALCEVMKNKNDTKTCRKTDIRTWRSSLIGC